MIYTSKYCSNVENLSAYLRNNNSAPIFKKWHDISSSTTYADISSKNRLYKSTIRNNSNPSSITQDTKYQSGYTSANNNYDKAHAETYQPALIYIEAEANNIDICGYRAASTDKHFLSMCNTEDLAVVFWGGSASINDWNNDSFVYIDGYTYFNPSGLKEYISAAAAMGLGDAAEYVIQPIFYAGKNTHLFSVTKNSDSVTFPIHTVIKLSGVEYFTVAPNIVVKAKEEE